MKLITFARWEIECDSAITRALYTELQSGAPEACGCAPCRNFAAARQEVYPTDVMRLFDQLGIAHNREAEVYHTHRLVPGRHRYGGWFHFVGRIVSGSDAAKQITIKGKQVEAWSFDLEKVGAEFEVGFTQRIGLLRESFEGRPVVQLEFQAVAPWLLAEEEPET